MSDMEFPSWEEISYWSGDKRGSWFTKEAVLAWGIPFPAPAGWARALKTKDAAFFIQHRIQIKRRPIVEQTSDDLFTWG